ncbi:MAG TPA: hypothetical protein VII25_03640, partial [Candidatus Acidoferrum sp.]
MLTIETFPLSDPADGGLNCTVMVNACEADNVTGVPAPLKLYPVPLMLICEIVTLAFPVLVIVTFCCAELPVFTLPKLRLVELSEIVAVAAIPVPLKATVLGEVGALLTSETLPVTAPADCGANCTLKLLDAPGLIDSGRLNELVENPLPVALTCVIVSTPVPLFVICIVCVFGAPTVTFPKLTLEGVSVTPAWTPLPLTGITALDPCVLETVTFPVTVSAAEGLNVKFSAAFCPGVNVSPVAIPLAFTSLAFTLTCEIVTLALPLFVIVTLLELELPELTLPKLMLLGLGDIVTDAATPVPLTATTFGELSASL